MTTFIALLRAINVGGTGTLPMKELSALCAGLGLENVQTYIQSGNVVFESRRSEEHVRTDLERVLHENMGGKIDVMVRTAAELRSILDANPFPHANPAQVAVAFFTDSVPEDLAATVRTPGREEVRAGTRELYIHYPDGMGQSKLKLPRGRPCTARNINTVARLVAMATG